MTARDTARDQARRRTAGRDGPSVVAGDALPALPERLIAARERKGVDLYRAERDTKIRARYLAALERGDYRELPGTVYTKGFLRNYALYLGLDADDVLEQFHRERGDAVAGEPALVVPRPITAPRTGFTFTPGVLVAALLTVGVIAFAAYLGLQLLRFSKPPTIAVTDPATAVSQVDETTTKYTLRGTSMAGATITVTTPGRDPIRATAAPDGTWSVDVELRRGKNQFDVTATDPDTGKQAQDPATVFITVPFSVVQAPTLTVDQPADGATFENGAIPVQGTTTNAASVVVSASYLGPAGGTTSAKPSPTATPKARPAGTPAAPTAAPVPTPQPQTVPVADDGSFSVPYELTAGRWTITVTASSAEAKTVSISRTVTVQYKGVNLVVNVKGGKAWLKAWVDGQVDPTLGSAGKVIADGKTLTFSGQQSVEVRTGSSGYTYFTLNGTSLGALGKPGVPETWLFAPPAPPTQTQHR
jgi:cytoskeletal protein RodZ